MANGRNPRGKGDAGRDAGGFVALPWSVLDSPAYQALSHPAKALLLELARQFVLDNNGRLLASRAYLAKRGWHSPDVIDRAKRHLLEAGFIFETVKGHRPNKASWYAVTWRTLDRHPSYGPGAAAAFDRGAYRHQPSITKNAGLSTPPVPGGRRIGTAAVPVTPQPVTAHGPIGQGSAPMPATPPVHLLETPSAEPLANAYVKRAPVEADRVRDCDLDPALFDPVTGEHAQPKPRPARAGRVAAEAWVAASLSR